MTTLKPKTMQPIYTAPLSIVKITELARDVAIYGDTDLAGVLQAHNVTHEQYTAAQKHSAYISEVERVTKQMSDPHGALRVKAQNMLPTSVDIIGEIALDRYQPASARLKAIEMVSKLAGVEDSASKQHAPVVVHLDFGGIVPTLEQPQTKVVVAVDAQPTSTAAGGWEIIDD